MVCPSFFSEAKKKGFFLGTLLCFCLMVTLSCHIWNIHIEGNIRNSTPEILEFLEEQGIVHGIARRKVNCSQIAASVRKQYPEITWVSARIEGTRLILTIQEGVQQDAVEEETSPCSLVSELEGTIVKIITRTGFPIVKEGNEIKKGDLLVAGRLELKTTARKFSAMNMCMRMLTSMSAISFRIIMNSLWNTRLRYRREP